MGVVTNKLLALLPDCELAAPDDTPAVVRDALLLLAAARDVAGVDDLTRPLTDLANALTAGTDQPEAAAVARALTGQDPTP